MIGGSRGYGVGEGARKVNTVDCKEESYRYAN